MGPIMSRKSLPLVIILGSTGTGKTKLSLELAKEFKGEIIGSDSMQIYQQLDIASAKASKTELSSIRHHMINILEPLKEFNVFQYQSMTVSIIDKLLENNILPILIGGTNYYIESVLWKILIQNTNNIGKEPINYDEASGPELHEILTKYDPIMANRLHPKNTRKIIRSLEVYHNVGRKHSEILAEQQRSKDGSTSGGGLRYDNVIILWLQCDQDILNQRLDDRVDEMIEQGLLAELEHFHKLYNDERLKLNKEPDYTKGIYQLIGFKEFHPYLILPEQEKNTATGQKLLQEGIENLRIATKRYARKQIKWIRNRFLGRKDRKTPSIYGLNTSDLSLWNENVKQPANEIIKSILRNERCKIEPLAKLETTLSQPNCLQQTFKCDICDRIFIGEMIFQQHLKSNKHKHVLKKLSIKQITSIIK